MLERSSLQRLAAINKLSNHVLNNDVKLLRVSRTMTAINSIMPPPTPQSRPRQRQRSDTALTTEQKDHCRHAHEKRTHMALPDTDGTTIPLHTEKWCDNVHHGLNDWTNLSYYLSAVSHIRHQRFIWGFWRLPHALRLKEQKR